MSTYKRISVYEADALLSENPDAVLVDCRDDFSFSDSHHPRAQLLTDKVLRGLLRNTAKTLPVIVYCYHGHKSRDIAKMFADFGFKSCFSVDGGYAAWRHQISYDFPKTERLQAWLTSKRTVTDINARLDSEGRTALMYAAKEANLPILRDLIEAGAEPNLTDNRGNNALWYACISQSLECARALINADIEADNQNLMGFSALNYAVGIDDIFQLISDSIGDNILVRLSSIPSPSDPAPKHKTIALQ